MHTHCKYWQDDGCTNVRCWRSESNCCGDCDDVETCPAERMCGLYLKRYKTKEDANEPIPES